MLKLIVVLMGVVVFSVGCGTLTAPVADMPVYVDGPSDSRDAPSDTER